MAGADGETVVLSLIELHCWPWLRVGGAEGTRTPDIRLAKAALSQLSYGPRDEPMVQRVSGPGWVWWAILDSNQRPQSYQDCALTC